VLDCSKFKLTLSLDQEMPRPTVARRCAATSSGAAGAGAVPSQPTLEELCAAARRDVLARLGLLSQQPSTATATTQQTRVLDPGERDDAAAKAVANLKTDGVLSASEGRGISLHPAVQQSRGRIDNPPPVEELCAAARRDVLARLGFVGRVPPPPPSNTQQQLSSSDGMGWSCGESLASIS
jgi:hypothetical protein